MKSHAQTIKNFEKFREETESKLKEHCENEKKNDITITELTKAKEVAESSLQDTLNDLEATKSSLGSQYDSLKEQFEPLKKDSQMLKKFKNVLNELQNSESGAGKSSLNLSQSFSEDDPREQFIHQIMEEKSVLTEKFESVQNQLLETQNALTDALEKEKTLKRKKMLKMQAKNEKKLKLNSEIPELSDESDEDEDENDEKIEKSEIIEQN